MVELNIEIDRDAYVDSFWHSINYGGSSQLGIEYRRDIVNYTIDSVLDLKHFVDSDLYGPDDYINGAWFWDATAGAGSVISDFDALTDTVSLFDSIPGMKKGDYYAITDLFKRKETFIHYPIDVIPPNAIINLATLNIYVAVAKPIYRCGIGLVEEEDWGEYTLTYDNKPPIFGMEGSIPVDEIGWKVVDIKEIIEWQFLYSEYYPNYGLGLSPSYEPSFPMGIEIGPAFFYSRESAFKPFVIIDYTPPAIIRGTSWIID